MKIYALGKESQPYFFIAEKSCKNEFFYRLKAENFMNDDNLTVHFPDFSAKSGEDGFYILPGNGSTPGSPLITFQKHENTEMTLANMYLSLFAAKVHGEVYVVMIDRTYRFKVKAICENGVYSVELNICVDEPIRDDITMTVLVLDKNTDENGIAKAVRNYRLQTGRIRPLAVKCQERKELDYIRKYPLVRIRMAWKPAPSQILHQTPENEPPLHIACTFKRVREIVEEMKRQGIEGAEISLVGWNRMGHDGRWPQIFPVEPALGGQEELEKTIKYVKDVGYMITCHNNFLDHYEIADTFSLSELARCKNGSALQIGKWSGGAAYRACPICQADHALVDYPKIAALGFYGTVYTDVLSMVTPDICFSEQHPCNTAIGIDCMNEIMKKATEEFGGFSSEGCMDFCDSRLDFSLYNTFRDPAENPTGMADHYVPLTELIYHGIFLYNPSSVTVNFPIKEANDGVYAALLGGRPTFYYYSRFCDGARNWMGETDLTCDDREQLEKSVKIIKETYDRYREIADKQAVFLQSYTVLENGLKLMTYEDGTVVAGNTSDSSLCYKDITVPANSWQVFEKE